MTNTTHRPTVVVLGGGYAGIKIAKGLDTIADVTLVDASDAFFHNSAAWRALVEPQWLERVFMPYDRLLHHGRFLRDRVEAVEGRAVTLASGTRLEPDYLVLATGSRYAFPAKTDEADSSTSRAKYREAHRSLVDARRVLVVGAGPSGLELAGEIKASFPDKQVTIVDEAPHILSGPFDQELRDELHRQLAKLGVDITLGSRLLQLPTSAPATAGPVAVTTEAGEELTADIWFRCFGVVPQTGYLRGAFAGLRDEQGFLAVDEYLRVGGLDNVFAVGDMTRADASTIGAANAQAQLLEANLTAVITGEGDLTPYQQLPPMTIIPLGPEGGAGQLPGHDGILGADKASAFKGNGMLVDLYTPLFDAPVHDAQS